MKRLFKKLPKGAIVAGLILATVEGILIFSFENRLDFWMLAQAGSFWFGCGLVVYQLNTKREIKYAVFYTFLLNLPWFINLSLANGKTIHLIPLMIASILMGLGIGYITKWFNPNSEITIEWAPFEILEDVSEEKLLEASNQLQIKFLDQQEGFIRRELLHVEGRKWVDLIFWESNDFAKQAMEQVMKNDVCLKYFNLMIPIDQDNDGGVVHLTRKCEYMGNAGY